MLRILHVITSMRTGGAERLVSQLLPRFKEAGAEVHLAVFDGSESPFIDTLREEGVTVHTLGEEFRSMYDPRNIYRLSRLMSQGFDIVHTHNTSAQLFTALARRPGKTLLVTTEHNVTNRRRGRALLREVDRWMYRHYDRIVCCSKAVETALDASLNDPELSQRIITISNGIDIGRFKGHRHTIIPGETVNIVMVAAFRPQKDHLTPIRALAKLPGRFRLIFAGDGVTRPEAEELAKALGVADRVRFAGNVRDVPLLYREADIALLSTHHEGLSLTTIEAMASGVPLIASDVDGVTETVGDSALLFTYGDENALAQRIMTLATDSTLYDTLIGRGMTTAAKHDINDTAKSYFNLYSTLTSGRYKPNI